MNDLVAQYTHTFDGGECTAYLTKRAEAFFIHTVTRFPSGNFLTTLPAQTPAHGATASLVTVAEATPLN